VIGKFPENFILTLKKAILDLFRHRNQPVSEISQYSQAKQKLLEMHYRHMVHAGMPIMPFEDVGFRVFSESNEDGILLYVFSLIGTTNKQLVDIGVVVFGSNTANLIVNDGCTGYPASLVSVADIREFVVSWEVMNLTAC
jgi:hypothetical protein